MTSIDDGARPPGARESEARRHDTVPLSTPARDPFAGVEHRVKAARTSAAATFALVFGLTALLCALSVLLSPLGAALAVVGLLLGVLGIRASRRVGITGRALAVSGLLLSVLALVVAGALAVGATTFLNDQDAVNRLENRVQQLRDDLPRIDVPGEVTPG